MKIYSSFNKNRISLYMEFIKIFNIIFGFEIGYFSGEENSELSILNFDYVNNTVYFELLKIHKFSITLIFILTFLD